LGSYNYSSDLCLIPGCPLQESSPFAASTMPLITGTADDQTLLKRTRSRRESTRSKRDSALVLKKHPRTSWSKTAHHLPTDDDQRSARSYEDKPLPSLPPSNPSFQLANFLRTTGPPKEKPSPKQGQAPKFSVQNSRYFPFRSRARRQGASERAQNTAQPPANLSSATIQRRVTKKGLCPVSKYNVTQLIEIARL